MAIESINPATGEKIRSVPALTPEAVRKALTASERAFGPWRALSFGERGLFFKKIADLLRRDEKELSRVMALEMGKPLAQGKREVNKCAWVSEYYAEEAEKFLAPEEVRTDAARSLIAFEPLGVVLAVMPWNFPLWQVFRAAAPAMMAGNVMVLKHASNVPGSAEAVERLFQKAGFPEGAFVNLWVETEGVAELIEHPAVKAVTLTGSVRAGKAVASRAGSVLKKTVLELGGSDPYIILEDADLDPAVQTCGEARMVNGGQSCVAAKRFIVTAAVYEKFAKGIVEYMKKQKMGDPLEEGVTLGPMARLDLRDAVHRQVEQSVAKGAKVLLGGKIPGGEGAYYPATVLGDVRKGMPAYDEEVFGPVASLIRVKDKEEAVRVANDTCFGLGAAVFTKDSREGERIAHKELEAGFACVNTMVKSDPRLPFGGVRESGYGRELSAFGIREFVNIKTVYVK